MPNYCSRCNKTVYFNEEQRAMEKFYHKSCFVCGYGYGIGAGVLSSENANGTSSTKPTYAKPSVSSFVQQKESCNGSRFGKPELCARCKKAVYLAEKMIASGNAWHKISCFNCAECHKTLESTRLCEKDGEIYCKACYGKNWGPKGYGHGINPVVVKPDSPDI